jgi:nucleoside diphosphate kinase
VTTSERSLVLVKPDGFKRGLTGEVIAPDRTKGYRLVALRILTPTRDMLAGTTPSMPRSRSSVSSSTSCPPVR